jgi:hypothetical protein
VQRAVAAALLTNTCKAADRRRRLHMAPWLEQAKPVGKTAYFGK